MPPAWPSSHNSLVGLHGIYKDVSKRDKKRVRVHVSVTRGGNLFRAVTWPVASPKMLPPGTSTQLIGTTYLPSLPLKEIFFYLHGTSRHTCKNLVSLEIRTTKKLRGRQVNHRIDKLFGILCNPALRPISCKIPQQGK